MARKLYSAAGRKGTVEAIRKFRAALRSGDCRSAPFFLLAVERGYARRQTVQRLRKQYKRACSIRRRR
jgi:hypothetical protein